MIKRSDEIAAICTPNGKSGIGIIRLSGIHSLEKAAAIVQSKVDITSFKSSKKRRIVFAFLVNDTKEKIDEIILVFMPKGKSFTGEPTVEFHCHGGQAVLNEGLRLIISKGARLAEPGEFTRRAVENGRINLIQAETIYELINTKNSKALNYVWQQYDGKLFNCCADIKEKLVTAISNIHLITDFDYEFEEYQEGIIKPIEQCTAKLKEMEIAAERSKYILYGCKIVLFGAPNVGKSSLFNSILSIERSIVCDDPGTTRDHVSETLDLKGIEVKLIDTAGIRKTDNKIEAISIDNSLKQIENADLLLYVVDANQKINETEEEKINDILKENGYVLFNKCDLQIHPSVGELYKKLNSDRAVYVSANNGTGIAELMNRTTEDIQNMSVGIENFGMINIRQKKLIEQSSNSLKRAAEKANTKNSLDFISYEVEQAIFYLKEVLGEIQKEEIYNNIFNKFCIGK